MQILAKLEQLADNATGHAHSLITRLRGTTHTLRGRGVRPTPARPRVTFMQFGDYRDAFLRFGSGGDETYYAQRYTVDFVASLARAERAECVHMVTFASDAPAVELEPRLWHSGVHLYVPGQPTATDRLIQHVAATRPTHLVVGAPFAPLIRYGLDQDYRVLPLFADSFRGGGLKQRARNAALAYTLNDPRIEIVSNHNLGAALDLVRIGVDPHKVVPFDWPALISPSAHPPKSAPPSDRTFQLLYVGQLNEPKGVGDVIRAVTVLRSQHVDVSLSLIGTGDSDALSVLARELGVAEHVAVLGKRSHAQVQEAMRSHDAVVVPSRHSYPEGLPMTLYEALCSRTPIIASDHPMFALRMRDGFNALVFRAQSAAHLAARVRELMSNPIVYESLSRNAETAANDYLCPLKWDRLLTAWLDGDTHSVLSNAIQHLPASR